MDPHTCNFRLCLNYRKRVNLDTGFQIRDGIVETLTPHCKGNGVLKSKSDSSSKFEPQYREGIPAYEVEHMLETHIKFNGSPKRDLST